MDLQTKPFSQILVVLQASEDFVIPLARASRLCKAMQANMTVLISCFDIMNAKNKSALNDDLGDIVDQFREDVREELKKRESMKFLDTIFLSWQEKTSISTHKVLSERQFDLILKAPAQQGEFKRLFKSGLDNYFVSECPIPVWMVKPRIWDSSIEVMACVDLSDETYENLVMNKRILAISDRLSSVLPAQMHVTDCYYGEIGSMKIDYNRKRGFKREASVKQEHIEKLKLYIHEYALSDDQLHFEEGIPDDAIPSKADELQAEVAVIGNNEDSNVVDRMLGDTAMSLTKTMPCDILIIKPE